MTIFNKLNKKWSTSPKTSLQGNLICCSGTYVEKLVLDQNDFFSTNQQIPADLLKFSNVRIWLRALKIAADYGFFKQIRTKYDPNGWICSKNLIYQRYKCNHVSVVKYR